MTGTRESGKVSKRDIEKYRGQLLDWYDVHRRNIPWRAQDGETIEPYRVWLSEIMCQQTTVQAVKTYYLKFLEKWPTVQDLAVAPQEDVMAAWAGLGYYARARNLHKCAQIVANDLGGVFPKTEAELQKLPGIGEYTGAAIAAIAFNVPATVVDGNVERVVSRFFAVEEPLPAAKKTFRLMAHKFYDGFTARPGDLAQSFMDLGAGICIPKTPRCSMCPLRKGCLAYKKDIAAELPRRRKRTVRPTKTGNLYWVVNKEGEALFHRREEKGLLGGMVGLPTSEWISSSKPLEHPDFLSCVVLYKGKVRHVFTHFDLELDLYRAEIGSQEDCAQSGLFWAKPESQQSGLPTVFKKGLSAFMCYKDIKT